MKNLSPGFKGAWVPKEIWLATDIQPEEKMLFIQIENLGSELDGCHATNTSLAGFMQCDTKKIKKLLISLWENGYIDVHYVNPNNKTGRSIHTKMGSLALKYENYKNKPFEKTVDPAAAEKAIQAELKKQQLEDSFNEFWDLYPRKDSKAGARNKWAKLNGERDAIIADLKTRVWSKEKEFIPHATTYLNGRRWEDDNDDSHGPGFIPNAI